MSLAEEQLKPYLGKMTSLQWLGASIVLGIFFGFVDTLFIAFVLGTLKIQVPAWFGVPTTFTGFFLAGWIVARFGPRGISWQPPAGILVCVLLLMQGISRPEPGEVTSSLLIFFNYVIVPVIAMAICGLGMYVGRHGWQSFGDNLKRVLGAVWSKASSLRRSGDL